MEDNWIACFIECCGCFTTAFRKTKSGFTITPKFFIHSSGDYITTLDMLKGRLGGKVYLTKSGSAIFAIQNLSECAKLVGFLEKMEWGTPKRDAFSRWASIIYLILNKQHTTKEGILKIAKLRDEMNHSPSKKKKSYLTHDKVQKLIKQK